VYKDFLKNGTAVYSGYCVDMINDMANLLK
jgi:hypothetical protein